MEKLIIEPKDVAEFESLTKFLKENGIGFRTEDEAIQQRKEARKRFVETLKNIPKSDVSFKEITQIIEKVRSERNIKQYPGSS